ncbi:beta-ketoacyl synthase-like protein [Amycolatopsis sulphurea]|uniref:Beta-ketoacyl synthase-like protein n=1 Tax=Amycolatopsis sulphurea TaxID=76022 RepID=A0A2A9FAS9_9PSEU|nr:SDR family oxidoreductase [Amycolatopsis sulphurea]PFG47906.1 beta-ketoacyl synthase-like protein [Amycolatopsis sulphurea]
MTEEFTGHSPPGRARAGHERAVAVVGMGVVAPGASSPAQLWRVLGQDHNTFGEPEWFDLGPWFSADRDAEDKGYIRRGGFLRDFRPHPELSAELERGCWQGRDQTTVLLRHCLMQAREGVATATKDRFGCYMTATSGGSLTLEESILTSVAAGHGGDPAALAARYPRAAHRRREALPDMVVRNAFAGLLPEGTDWLALDTACSSALYAIDLGAKSLLAGDCDIAFCGGGNTGSRRDVVLFSKLNGLSPTGELRAFDADAGGVLFSDAAAVATLKRLDRAVADNDDILAVLGGFGGSTDGQGSVMAPDIAGLRLAIHRARSVNATDPSTVDWVIAHGTGTPVGDLVELQALTELAGEHRQLCTSNKPLLGHAAWAAGAVSMVHALLALRHGIVRGERYFTALPADAPHGAVTIPVSDVPWHPTPGRPRVVGISALGFGGTNGHLLAGDLDADADPPQATPAAVEQETVLVGWAAHLPGAPTAQQVRSWVRTGEHAPARSFGELYPLPPIRRLKMPPVAARSTDRTHLMGIAAVEQFVADQGEPWHRYRETTGVFTAHMGPTRSLIEYTVRTGATDLTRALPRQDALAESLALLKQRLPAANGDSMPGYLASVISSRVANRLRLHGVSMALDSGHASTQAALHVARRYLATGELDVALVLAVNGNSTPIMAEFTETAPGLLAEGAVLLVLTRRSLATEQGWPVLARVHTGTGRPGDEDRTHRIRWGERTAEPSYLGADGALGLLRALESGLSEVEIASQDPGPRVTFYPTTTGADRPATPAMAHRSVVVARRRDAVPGSAPLLPIPPGGVLLVSSATIAAELAAPARRAGATLLCTESTETALPALDGASPHVRIIASARDETARWPAAPSAALLRLQEWALLACQRLGARLDHGSVAALLLDPLRGQAIHPHLTLITGFIRSLALEVPCPAFAVVTDATLSAGLEQLAAESAACRDRAVLLYRCGARYVEQACPAPLPAARPDSPLCLVDDAVVVATGGGRGVTSVAVTALAQRIRLKVWLLGTTPLQDLPDGLLDTADGELAPARAAFIAARLKSDRDLRVADLNHQFDDLLRIREITLTLRRLRRLCGADRVHYLVCDIAAADQIHAVARQITDTEGTVDLLVHGAGRLGSAMVADKTLAGFRAVRDTKVTGYHNLKQAFADPAPRLWCNFSSASGLVGWPGDTDYSPANEYLTAAARYESQVRGTTEFTIGWGLWAETGMVRHILDTLSRRHHMTGLTNNQGAEVFLTELAEPRPPEPVSLYGLGEDGGWPRARDFTARPATTAARRPHRQGVLLTPAPSDTDTAASWTWQADPERDGYLREHVIDGRPVLPAVIMLAMAGEAATRLAPGTTLTGFRGFRIEEPLYADPDSGTPASCRIHAVHRDPTTVDVSIRSDLTTPDGRLLRRDRLHCHTSVTLGAPPGSVRRPGGTGSYRARLDDDTTMRPDIPVRLSGVWRTLSDLTADPTGAHARWLPHAEPGGVFAHLCLPALLLDSLCRLSTWHGPGLLHMGVPLSIEHVELFTTDSDVALARRHPAGLDLYHDAATGSYHAVAPAGEVLVRITGFKDHVVRTVPIPIHYPQWRPVHGGGNP